MDPKFINYKSCNEQQLKEMDFPIFEVKVRLALVTDSKAVLFKEDLEHAVQTLFNNKICVEGIPEDVAYLEYVEATVKETNETGVANNG